MTKQTRRTQAINHYEVNEMALSLAQAEALLRLLTADKVDAIIDADGKPYLLRPAQEQLRERAEWLDAVIEGTADVITVVNREGVILFQSHYATRVLGYGPEELVGTNIFKLIPLEDLPPTHLAFFNVIEGLQESAVVQFNHRSQDGSYRPVEATIAKLRDGNPPSVVFSMRPVRISTREAMEITWRETETARLALKEKRFLAMLAHELRTPLMPVLLGISEMQDDPRFAQAASILAMMRRNIEMQAVMLEELTDFTTVGEHKVRLKLERIDVHEAIRFVLEICRTELEEKRIEVALGLKALQHMVFADLLRIQQIMWNLLRNAIKFSPAGSLIFIETANETSAGVTIEFVDNGIGIDQDFLGSVFNPFEQEDRSIQRRFGGLGLGMYIARGLAEAQKGTLSVSSEGKGHGATFRLSLELAQPSDEPPAMSELVSLGILERHSPSQ
jgi:PAS domain S-box-containing protein